MSTQWKIFDAKDQILGRFCSRIAKLALLGEHIVIINAKDAVVSGRRNQILAKYIHLHYIGDIANPHHGPFFSNRPDTFIRQKIRFMLPHRNRGKESLSRVHVYITAIPSVKADVYKESEPLHIPNISTKNLAHKYITVEDICNVMGWTRKRGPTLSV
jgi:large subunit ribosomal protein L13